MALSTVTAWGYPTHHYETLVDCGAEAARFDSAVFRFIERNAGAYDDRAVTLHSVPEGECERKIVALWSAAAALDFSDFWRRFRDASTWS